MKSSESSFAGGNLGSQPALMREHSWLFPLVSLSPTTPWAFVCWLSLFSPCIPSLLFCLQQWEVVLFISAKYLLGTHLDSDQFLKILQQWKWFLKVSFSHQLWHLPTQLLLCWVSALSCARPGKPGLTPARTSWCWSAQRTCLTYVILYQTALLPWN